MRRRLLASTSCALLFALFATPAFAQRSAPDVRAEVTARADAPARLSSGGVTLDIVPGAVQAPTRLEVTALAPADVAPLDPGMTNVTRGGGAYRFGPHGSHFSKNLTLTLPWDPARLPAGTTAEDVRAFYFDEARGCWQALERVSVDPSAGAVTSLTDHFTDIIASTLVLPTNPEVASFAPTMMRDMTAADPALGVALIQPPQASSMGAAQLSLPLDLPPGRNGMQPKLEITYNSDGGDGWLGVGWDLTVPQITVDTRWGVPRYGVIPDADGNVAYQNVETESYLMDGLALTPLAHRGAFETRTGDLKVFHARVESSLDRIVRHGSRPDEFWWEVTDGFGTRTLYGDVPGLGGGPATLRDDAGNVFRWALREVLDLNGNALRFDYERVNDPGQSGSAIQGRQLYLKAINYTGTEEAGGAYQPGPFTVRFLRDGDVGAPRRDDVSIDYRGGFKQVTAALLREVRVEMEGAPVRAWVLEYENGAFGKTRLNRVRVRGADGVVDAARDHQFSYFNDVRDATGPYGAGFKPEESWTMPDDNLSLCNDLGPLSTCPASFAVDFDRASAMSGSITHGIGGHLYLGLNCGLPTKLNSFGLKTGFNLSRTTVNLGLLDVNGDNLPDKVFRSGNQFMYRANQGGPGGVPAFSAAARPLPGLDGISVETGVSTSIGAEQYFAGTSALVNATATLTVGSTYTTDANGDGLIDLVRDGEILFSHPGPGGDPEFENTSANTPQPLAPGSLDGDGLIQDYEPLFQDLLDDHPLHDVLRRWIAPWTGTVRISGDVTLETPDDTEDGVRVSIQKNGAVLWSAGIAAGDGAPHAPTGTDAVAVTRGDRLYFRVQSVFDGAMDGVDWSPRIDYVAPAAPRDVNGLDPLHYGAAEDFVMAGRPGEARAPFDGEASLTGVFVKRDTTTDDVALTVLRNDVEVFRTTVPWDSTGEVPLDVHFHLAGDDSTTYDVNESDRLRVRIVVDSPIDAAQVGWREDAPPEVVYQATTSVRMVYRADDEPAIRFFVPSDMDLYPADDLTLPQKPWVATMNAPFDVRTMLSGEWTFRVPGGGDPVRDGTLVFTVKRRDRRVLKALLDVHDGTVENRTLTVNGVASGDSLFFDVSMRDPDKIGTVATQVKTPPGQDPVRTEAAPGPNRTSDPAVEDIDVPIALHRALPLDDVPVLGRGLFGQPYRGWAYAGYNGNPPRDDPERPHACSGDRVAPTAPIDESALVLDASLGDIDEDSDPDDVEEQLAAQPAYVFTPLWERLPDGTLRAAWRGPSETGWIQAGSASAARLGMDNVGVPCGSDVDPGGTTADARAVPRIGVSGNVGAGAGFIISVSASAGTSGNQLDFLDLNGDQYPDITGNGRAQYTLPNGGLERRSRNIGFAAVRRTNNTAGSVSLGGSMPLSKGGSRGTTGANNTSGPKGERVDNLMPSLGFSGDLGFGTANVETDLTDINGDGLPDRVNDNGNVELNTGYGFAPAEPWPGLAALDQSLSFEFTLGAGLGFNDFIYSFAGGLSYTREVSHTSHSLVDMNGDGLVDRVREEDGSLWVGFNRGAGFVPDVRWGGAPVDHVASSTSASLGGGVFGTVGVPIFPCSPVTLMFLIINPGVFVSGSMARQEEALMDVDGDRAPDHVLSERDDQLKVARNGTGRTNLLRSVERPLGGHFELNYRRLGNLAAMPQSAWALASVDLYDGVEDDGPSPLHTDYRYLDPVYDRGEREFYGFGEVLERQGPPGGPPLRTIARTYRNDSFYARGLPIGETVEDAAGNPLRRVTNSYRFRDIETGATPVTLQSRTATILPLLAETRIETLEDGGSIASRRTFEYDASGNITHVTDYGDEGPEDDLEAEITYADCEASGISGRPTRIVISSAGTTLAERQATVDCATGDVLQIRQVLADGSHADTDLSYDARGLVASVTGPPNLHGQRYTRTFEYDPVVGTHVTHVTDSYGLESRATFDPRFGLPTSTTDASGNRVDYTYDAFGRTVSVTGPYEQGTGHPTIAFTYEIGVAVPWARTRHFDVLRPDDPIETVLFVDGLGRLLQTKVDGTVRDGAPPARDGMVVSGRSRYDVLGRAVEQYQPVTEPPGTATVFNPTYDAVTPTRVAYDPLDRPVVAIEPDGAVTQYRRAIAPDAGGLPRVQTTVTDANGNRRSTYRDARDLLVAVGEGNAGDLWTTYRYDALDRLVAVRDPQGSETRMAYDALGRRIALERPDAGTTRYAWDLASNLVARTTASLGDAQPITYDYDFGRLLGVHYPVHPENDVRYTYGVPGDANAAGRLVHTVDAVGEEALAYGKLGEVVRQVRSITGHGGGSQATRTYTTGYRYDTWGRLLEIDYPDGEVVSYGYDAGGLVNRVTGVDGADTTPYLARMEYDKFQQQALMEFGNGVVTTYRYRPEDQRMVGLTSALHGAPFQNLAYTYDAVGNIMSLVNDVHVAPPSGFGGPTEEHFAYDDLYRLVHASGTHAMAPHKSDGYTLDLEYDAAHNLVRKVQTHEIVTPSGQHIPQHKSSYAFDYRYDPARPHAPAAIGERALTFDGNGNQTGWDGGGGVRRSVVWDEEDRVMSISDPGQTTTFAYDAHGARTLKRGPGGEMAYVNQFFSVRNGEIGTKHIYVGSTRLASIVSRQPDRERGPPTKARDVYYYHPDHLFSTQFVTDGSGALREHRRYFPSGEPWIEETRGPVVTDLRYSGREYDSETGLYYFGARYYDPRIGQFISPDPMSAAPAGDQAAWSPPALNVYAYAYGNPVRMVDPSGTTVQVWSQAGRSRGNYVGVAGRSVGGGQSTGGGDILRLSDSPVRAGAASGTAPVVAEAGVGVMASDASTSSHITTRRERGAAGMRTSPSARGPPATAALSTEGGSSLPPVVLGENMAGRVIPYAKQIGAETIVDWLDGREWSQQLNDEYIEHIKDTGRQVVDIGPDFARRLAYKLNPPTDRSGRPVYEGEREQLRGYRNYVQKFRRTGKYSGGVPNFDKNADNEDGTRGLE